MVNALRPGGRVSGQRGESRDAALRYMLFVLASALLHAGAWQLRAYLDPRPETLARPIPTIEVTLMAAPKAAELGPAPAPPPKAPPQPPAPPSALPQAAKAEPQPKPTPKPKPSPQPKPPKPKLLPRPDSEPDPNRLVERTPQPEVTPQSRPFPKSRWTESTPAAPRTPGHSPSRTAAPSAPVPARPGVGAPSSIKRPELPRSGGSAAGGAYEGAKANAAYLHNPRPEYPALAKRRQWEGRVLLKVQVLASGRAAQVSIAASSGHEVLDEAALDAVRHWHFVPAKRGGQPVDSWVNVPINFNLE